MLNCFGCGLKFHTREIIRENKKGMNLSETYGLLNSCYLSLWNNNNQLDFDACNVFSCPWIAGLQSPRTFILDTGMPANDQRSMPNRFDQIDVSVNWFVDQARCQACQTPLIHNGHRLTGAVLTDIGLLKRLILHVPFKTVVIVAFGWLPLFLWSFYDATYLRVTFGSKVNKMK